jgi:hypothetical protein
MTEKERLEIILDALTSQGFKLILDDIKEFYDAINDINGVETEAQLHYRKGELARLGFILNLESWYQHQYDEIL